MSTTNDGAEPHRVERFPPPLGPGDVVLIRAIVVEAYDRECCVQVEVGTRGMTQKVYVTVASIAVVEQQLGLPAATRS